MILNLFVQRILIMAREKENKIVVGGVGGRLQFNPNYRGEREQVALLFIFHCAADNMQAGETNSAISVKCCMLYR